MGSVSKAARSNRSTSPPMSDSIGVSVTSDVNTGLNGCCPRSTKSSDQPSDEFLEEKNKSDSDDRYLSRSFGELVFSTYLPMADVWMRQCMFGIAILVRSILVGQYFRSFISHFSEHAPAWLQTISLKEATKDKVDPHAWPPPAFTVLATLTLFALLVHPDGFTWILIDKLRRIVSSTRRSTTQIWVFLVEDYGIITSAAVLLTLSSLLFLLFVMHRTLSPRHHSSQVATSQEKKKKRRRGHTRHRGNGGGTRTNGLGNHGLIDRGPGTIRNQEVPSLSGMATRHDSRNPVKTVPPDGRGSASISDKHTEISMERFINLSASHGKEHTGGKEKERVSSVSTIDTTPLSDDLSCGSASVKSLQNRKTTAKKTKKIDSDDGSLKGKGISSNRRRLKRGGRTPRIERGVSERNGKSSRWDALKPNQNAPRNHDQLNRQQARFHNNGNINYKQKRRDGGKYHRKDGRHDQAIPIPAFQTHQPPRLESPIQFTSAAVKPDASTSLPQLPPDQSINNGRRLAPPPPGLGQVYIPPGGAPTNLASQDSISLPTLAPILQRSTESVDVFPRELPLLSSKYADMNREWQDPHNLDQFSAHSSPFASQFLTSPHLSYENTVKENPFADSGDSRIEAELRELGGQMAGSILDF
eukprot:scaffold8353_cov138-Cylindrotheca_fusiformis.AAC.4